MINSENWFSIWPSLILQRCNFDRTRMIWSFDHTLQPASDRFLRQPQCLIHSQSNKFYYNPFIKIPCCQFCGSIHDAILAAADRLTITSCCMGICCLSSCYSSLTVLKKIRNCEISDGDSSGDSSTRNCVYLCNTAWPEGPTLILDRNPAELVALLSSFQVSD